MGQQKILIICLDGFTWLSGDTQVSSDNMPFFRKLLQESSKGVLKSVIPWETGPAWTAFQTGAWPGKTSIFTFQGFSKKKKELFICRHNQIGTSTIWKILNSHNKQFISINLPMTYPVNYESGIVVPGLLSPGVNEKTVKPPNIYKDYIKPLKRYCITQTGKNLATGEFVKEQISVEEERLRLANMLIKKKSWDVFCIQVHGTDNIQHYLWPYLDRSHPDFSENGFEVAGEFYKSCDNIIKELVEAAGENALVLVVSDHGFCRLKYRLRINSWLRQKGYLNVYRKQKGRSIRNNLKEKIYPLKVLAQFYAKYLKSNKKQVDWGEFMLNNLRANLDIENSKCFCLGGSGGLIYFNTSDDEKNALFEKLKCELLEEFGKDSPAYCIKSIHKGTEFYGVADNDVLPDMVCVFADGVFGELTPISEELVVGPEPFSFQKVGLTGTHSPDGVIVAHGKEIKKGFSIKNAEIIDIMPTVLAYMGIAIPENVDGKVLSDIFTKPLQIKYDKDDTVDKSHAEKDSYTDSDKDKIEQELANLGYM